MMKDSLNFLTVVLAVVGGGWLLGITLDEAGQGKLGKTAENLAKKATRGFGI